MFCTILCSLAVRFWGDYTNKPEILWALQKDTCSIDFVNECWRLHRWDLSCYRGRTCIAKGQSCGGITSNTFSTRHNGCTWTYSGSLLLWTSIHQALQHYWFWKHIVKPNLCIWPSTSPNWKTICNQDLGAVSQCCKLFSQITFFLHCRSAALTSYINQVQSETHQAAVKYVREPSSAQRSGHWRQ